MTDKYPKKSIRPTQDELKYIKLLRSAGVSRTDGGVIHKALDIGFRVLIKERGLMPHIKTENVEEVKV